MSNRLAATVCIAGFLALAWLPLGPHVFMESHWMKVGAFLAPLILFAAFLRRESSESPWLADLALMASVMLAAYLVHQVEEHWVDILGREYPLYDTLNTLIANLLGDDRYGAMTRSAIFYINAGSVWTIGFSAILAAPKRVFPVVCLASLLLVNGVAHVLYAFGSFAYNAGLLTSVLLFVPLSVAFLVTQSRAGAVSRIAIMAGIGYAVLAHVVLFAGLFAANVYGIVPVEFYYGVLIALGVAPVWFDAWFGARPRHDA